MWIGELFDSFERKKLKILVLALTIIVALVCAFGYFQYSYISPPRKTPHEQSILSLEIWETDEKCLFSLFFCNENVVSLNGESFYFMIVPLRNLTERFSVTFHGVKFDYQKVITTGGIQLPFKITFEDGSQEEVCVTYVSFSHQKENFIKYSLTKHKFPKAGLLIIVPANTEFSKVYLLVSIKKEGNEL